MKIIIYRYDTLGGTGTLSIRLAEYFVSKNYEVIYICNYFNDMNNVNTLKKCGAKVFKWSIKDIEKNLNKLYAGCKFSVLTYTLTEYMLFERLKGKVNIVKNLMYNVGYSELLKGKDLNQMFRCISKILYKGIIRKLINTNSVVFMDKLVKDGVYDYYDLNNKEDESIYFLPFVVNRYDFESISKKLCNKEFNILTILRADFPFKGYVFGLLDDSVKLMGKYKDIKLTIICHGYDSKKLQDKKDEQPVEIRERVTLISELVAYDDLRKYFDSSKLYIGMGTTILDAVNSNVPAISVLHNTYKNVTSGFFQEQPENLGAYENKIVNTIDLIEKVIDMSKEDYISLCKIQHDSLEKYYNIARFANNMINEKTFSDKKNVNKVDILINDIMVFLRRKLSR